MELPKRKSKRLKGFDYSTEGYYFVTICTHKHKLIFSKIVGQGLAPAENTLTPFGKIAEAQLLALEHRFSCVQIHKYVIMPNHIHAIIVLTSESKEKPSVSLSDIVCVFKSMTTRLCHQQQNTGQIFQASFHDHIIRGEQNYLNIWQYIDSNPNKWEKDCFFSE